MKSFIAGLATILILGLAGFYTFKGITRVLTNLSTSPSPTATPTITTTPSVMPSSTPSTTSTTSTDSTYTGPTTKGGLPIATGKVKGVTTTPKTTTTTTTTSRLFLTIVKSSICPISYTSEIKDIKGPLTLRYELIDNTSFGITIWNKDGNELLANTTYSGRSGMIKTISGVNYMKVRVESKSCASNNDNWLKLTAER